MFLLPIFLCSCAISLSSAAANTPATIELDLVFPRNETYAPTDDLFPIVFAVQGFPATEPSFGSSLVIRWFLQKVEGWEGGRVRLDEGVFRLDNKTNSSAPYFVNIWTTELRGENYRPDPKYYEVY